jgi:hypothetical protein
MFPGSSLPDKNKTGGNKTANSAKGDCPLLKWIKVNMTRKPRNKQPQYWPADVTLSYSNENFFMELTNSSQQGQLNKQGSVEFSNIPPGSCTFKCPAFYDEIEKFMRDELKKNE